MSKKIINMGFSEFLEDTIQSLTEKMEWMEDRTLKYAESIEEVRMFVDKAIEKGLCALDLETTGLNTRTKKVKGSPAGSFIETSIEKIVGIGLSYDSNFGLYIPINHKEDPELNLPEDAILEEINRLCANCIILFHNAKFDMVVLKNHNVKSIENHNDFEDTMLLARCYDLGQKDVKLKNLSERLLGQKMLTFEDIVKNAKRFDFVSPKIGYIYGASDPMCTLDLYNFFMSQDIVKEQMLIYNLEKRVVFVVMEMESNLVLIDVPHLMDLKKRTEKRIEEIIREVYKLAGQEFNIGSTQQLGKILFEKLNYRYPEKVKTASGQYKTDSATLGRIVDEYPVVSRIIEFRELEKALNTYINNLLANRDENDCVKLGFHQSGTDTGRFSSPGGMGIKEDGYSGVNIQSTPKIPPEENPWLDLRKAFIARPGKTIVAVDYENEEMRVATNLSKETTWIEALHKGADFHTATGAIISGKDIKDVTKVERQKGKCVAKGTLIASKRGWVPIENLKVGDLVITHKGDLKKVSKIWDMGIKHGVLITTKSGHKITCGLNHRFMTPDGKWIKARHLKIDQIIRTASCKKMQPNKIQRIHFNIWNKGNNNFISKDLPYIEISPLWARLMGYLIGDGSINLNSAHIVCSNEYEDVKEDILNTAKELGLNPTCKIEKRKLKNRKPLYKIHMGSRILVRFFREIGFTGRREWKKENKKLGRFKSVKTFRIPRIIFESPKKVSREFLRGLFETDGYVNKGYVNKSSKKKELSITTKDKEFAEDIQLLLSQFGIKTSIIPSFSKRYNRYYYCVLCSVYGAKIFEKEINFISKNKRERLHKITSDPKSRIYKSSGSYTVKWETKIKDIQFLDNVNLMDLTIEDDHTYIAQGLITHNTVNFLSLYLGGPRTLSAQAKVPFAEAQRILKTFFAGVPKLKKWIDNEILKARKLKKVKTVFGRIRPLAQFYGSGDKALEAHGDRCAINTQVQGASADIMKAVMSALYNWIHRNNFQNDIKMLITMHDELVFEITTEKLEFLVPEIAKIMMLDDVITKQLRWEIPLTVDVKYGNSWRVSNSFFNDFPAAKERLSEPLYESNGSRIKPIHSAPKKEIKEQSMDSENNEKIVKETPYVGKVEVSDEEELSSEKKFLNEKNIKNLSSTMPVEINNDSPELVYTIRDRRKINLMWLNTILNFMTKENKDIYTSQKKILRLRDVEGNSLLVSEYEVPVDVFVALARYHGI